MQSKAATVAEYLDELPEDRRLALSALRTLIRETAPDVTEGMQYGMAAYDLGGTLFALASQKAHMALYVADGAAVETHRERLGKLNCGKGCIRFRHLDDLPWEAVIDILRDAAAHRQATEAVPEGTTVG